MRNICEVDSVVALWVEARKSEDCNLGRKRSFLWFRVHMHFHPKKPRLKFPLYWYSD